jgi:hypothetical protein
MSNGNITPEEHLLNLIKNGKGKIKEISSEEEKVKTPVSHDLPNNEKQTVYAPKKIIKNKVKYIILVNKILLAGLFFAFVYMITNWVFPFKAKNKIGERTDTGIKEGVGEEITEGSHPVQYYEDSMNKRQLFKIFETPKPKPVEQKPKVTLQQVLSGYTFVGIIFGDSPQAIVEDKKSGQSYYLTEGQMLGEIKIEKVEQGKVTVSYGEETMSINI